MLVPDSRCSSALAARLRHALVAVAAWLALAGVAAPVRAQSPLVVLVPYPVGALSDGVARVVAPALARALDRPVVVENLGGAGGALAARRALKAPADGELLLQGSPNELILAPRAQPSAGFAAADFRMVQIIGSAPLVIVARADLPASSFGELAELASRSAPAQPLSYGSVGVGSLYHLLGRQLAQRLHVPMTHVPYSGGAPLMRDLAGGVVDFAILPAAVSTFALVDAGRLKLLGTLEPARAQQAKPRLRSLPSLAGDARMSDFTYSIWSGYFVRADTPSELAQRLNEALAIVLRDPQVIARIAAQGADPMPAMDLDESQAFYLREIARYDALASDGTDDGAHSPR
ncbi:MAG: tripartite tricarboxylate transporter substrate binding protein [Burkholderiaceae bacterium]|nr:tripartite tricarboxylate transporter substrate binding protein [Burkholderiaceae bacterium]